MRSLGYHWLLGLTWLVVLLVAALVGEADLEVRGPIVEPTDLPYIPLPPSVEQASRESVHNEPLKRITIGLVFSPEDNSTTSGGGSTRGWLSLETLVKSQLRNTNVNLSQRLKNPGGYQVDLISSKLVENPIEMSQIVCQQLLSNSNGGVSAVIVDTDPFYMDSIASISFTLGLYNIPVIGTTLRDSSLFNKNLHSSYISLIPPNSHQADVWFSIINELDFQRVFVMTSMENNDLLSRFVDLIDGQEVGDNKIEIEAIIEYDADAFENEANLGWLYLVERLSNLLENSICRVFLIHAQSKDDVQLFMKLLDFLNLTNTQDTALILSEETVQLVREINLPIPVGAIWSCLSLAEPSQVRKSYTMDALEIILRSIEEISEQLVMEQGKKPGNFCNLKPADVDGWQAGLDLYWTIRRQKFSGLTGYISFNENGDRFTAKYELLNAIGPDTQSIIGEFWNGHNHIDSARLSVQAEPEDDNLKSKILVNVSSIVWPGGISGHLISGLHIDRHLKIVTIEEKPFVWVLDERECWPEVIEETASLLSNNKAARIPCKKITDASPAGERFCCKGYCMDLLSEISHRLNFTYDLYLAPDNQYGNLVPDQPMDSGLAQPEGLYGKETDQDPRDDSLGDWWGQSGSSSSENKYDGEDGLEHSTRRGGHGLKWSGLMGDLVSRRADMAFAPLTITLKRAQAIDFSKPFKFHGFSILLRRAAKHTTLASFLQPFHNMLWILVIGVATHVVALTLYLLDRYSTLGHFGIKRGFIPKPADSHLSDNDNGDRPLHLSSSLWFSWSILLNSGVGEHTPKSLSGRVLGIFWSGFAMIVVASYTANLAAFLVLDSREETPTLSGIDDPRLRSGDLAFNFATIKNSAVDAYLQSQVEYINLYRKMEEFDFGNVDEAIRSLRAGLIDALIWDSTRLEWEVATDENCSLGIAGELFGSGGYGIGLQPNSHWTKNVTRKLLELHESGFMVELDKKWIAAGRGSRDDNSATSEGGAINVGSAAGQAADSCGRRNEDKPETLGVSNIAGVFILFALGLLVSLGLIVVEQLCYKGRSRQKLKRQQNRSSRQEAQTPSTGH